MEAGVYGLGSAQLQVRPLVDACVRVDRLAVNTRCLAHAMSGVERYTAELVSEFGGQARSLRPSHRPRGALGHLWEQARLPSLVGRGELLWSPANTGPLAVRNQVVTIHDVSPIEHPEWFSPAFAQWYGFLFPRLARRVRRVLTTSEFSRRRIIELLHVPPERVVAVPNGVSRRFTPAAAAGTAAGFRPYVLFVGSVQPRKNLRTLLHAWVEGEFARRPLELVIVGAGARAFAREPLGPCPRGVRFLGRVDEALLPVLYARATAFVLPSLYEGFGLPVLEAMASGVPVICANAAALPEVAGDAAVLVEPRDVHGLAHALARVLDEDQWQNELRARGLRRAAEFSWRATAARISSVLADAQAESAS